jgi:hypothetical protein
MSLAIAKSEKTRRNSGWKMIGTESLFPARSWLQFLLAFFVMKSPPDTVPSVSEFQFFPGRLSGFPEMRGAKQEQRELAQFF